MTFTIISRRTAAVKQLSLSQRCSWTSRAISHHGRALFSIVPTSVVHNAASLSSGRRLCMQLHEGSANKAGYSIKIEPTIKIDSTEDVYDLISRVGNHENRSKELRPIREDIIRKYESSFGRATKSAFKNVHEMAYTLLKYRPRDKELSWLPKALKKDAAETSKYFNQAEAAFTMYVTELKGYLASVQTTQADSQTLKDDIEEADQWLAQRHSRSIDETAERIPECREAKSDIEDCEKPINHLDQKNAGFLATKVWFNFAARLKRGLVGIFMPSLSHTVSDVGDVTEENRKTLITLPMQNRTTTVDKEPRAAGEQMEDNDHRGTKGPSAALSYLDISGGPLKGAGSKLGVCKSFIDIEEAHAIRYNQAAERMYDDHLTKMIVMVENLQTNGNIHLVAKDLVRLVRLAQDAPFEKLVREISSKIVGTLASLPKEVKTHDYGSGRLLIDDLNDCHSILQQRRFGKPPKYPLV